jgi:hypothetical protein
MNMKRSLAADLLDRIRVMLAERMPPEEIERRIMEYPHHVPALTRCHGEAHTNPHIDNCGVCAPRWGWIGSRIVVK